MKYCVGLVFTSDLSYIWLIRKNKPAWQKGLLNGIGGKVEAGETFEQAMARESREESGYKGEWKPFAEWFDPHEHIKYFVSVCGRCEVPPITYEEEPIELWNIDSLAWTDMVPNMKWLIPAALTFLETAGEIIFNVNH